MVSVYGSVIVPSFLWCRLSPISQPCWLCEAVPHRDGSHGISFFQDLGAPYPDLSVTVSGDGHIRLWLSQSLKGVNTIGTTPVLAPLQRQHRCRIMGKQAPTVMPTVQVYIH